MTLLPPQFLLRVSYPCRHVVKMPRPEADDLLDLPATCRLDNFAAMDGRKNFADVRLAWNANGLGVQIEVSGKDQTPVGDSAKPRQSDGLSLWLDTRDARNNHRASRFCHQFHFLPVAGGPDRDEPLFAQSKINRAQQDAPMTDPNSVLLRRHLKKSGYRLEAFLPVAAMNGFDPTEHPKLGVYYLVRD